MTKDVMERFWSKVDQSGGPDACWPWTGAKHSAGYGVFFFMDRVEPSHRVVVMLQRGQLAYGEYVLHTCDNKPCCNPAHLYVGSQAQNMRDAVDRLQLNQGEKNGRSKLTARQVRAVRTAIELGWVTITDCSRILGVKYSSVHKIVSSQRWKNVNRLPAPVALHTVDAGKVGCCGAAGKADRGK